MGEHSLYIKVGEKKKRKRSRREIFIENTNFKIAIYTQQRFSFLCSLFAEARWSSRNLVVVVEISLLVLVSVTLLKKW